MSRTKHRSIHPLVVASVMSALGISAVIGCGGIGGGGGGGGSDEPNSTGTITMQLERDDVAVGNFVQVFVEAENINEDGVLIKLHYPDSLIYSKNSAVAFPGEKFDRDFPPFTESTTSGERYLVFFVYPRKETGDSVRLVLNLKAIEVDEDAFVEAGINNNDPNIPDSSEFSGSQPFFSADDRASVYIRGLSARSTPTPASSGTPSTSPTVTPTPAK